MHEIDKAFTDWPFLGVRQVRDYLALQGFCVGIKRVRRLMRLMGLMPIYQKPRTSIAHPGHKHSKDTGNIIHALDLQSSAIERAVSRSVENQNSNARDAERQFAAYALSEKK